MQPGEVGRTDDTGIVDELRNRKFRLRVVAARRKVVEVGGPDRLKQELAGGSDSAAEHENLRIEHRAKANDKLSYFGLKPKQVFHCHVKKVAGAARRIENAKHREPGMKGAGKLDCLFRIATIGGGAVLMR